MNDQFIIQLRRICGDAVLTEPLELLTYECDGLPHLRHTPPVVVLPSSAEQVQGVVRLCHRYEVPFVARGHGSGLSGGALPIPGGVVIGLARLNRVLDVDIPNRRVTVEPGVTNLEITRRVAPHGYYYAPAAPYPGYVWQPGYYVGYRWVPGAWVPRAYVAPHGHQYHGHDHRH